MKKKWLSIFLCSVMILGVAGCETKKDVEKEEQNLENVEVNQETNNTTENTIPQLKTDKDGNVIGELNADPNETIMEADLKNIDKMMPLMDSMLLCMTEGNYEFDTTNSDFVWNTMLYYIGNYLTDSEDITISEDYTTAIISEENVNKYMRGYILNDIPKFEKTENTPLITKNESSYSFGLGDRGLSELKMVSFSRNTDNSLDVDVKLVGIDDNSDISIGSFHLEPSNNEVFPMIIVNASVQRPQPKIQSGTIVEIQDEAIILEINGEEETYSLNENSANQVQTKAVGSNIDVMIDKDAIINILN